MSDTFWKLTAEDLTLLGGPMGTEYTTEDTIGNFKGLEIAKRAAQNHFGEGEGKELNWIKTEYGYRTEDLRWVMYHIYKEVVV